MYILHQVFSSVLNTFYCDAFIFFPQIMTGFCHIKTTIKEDYINFL